VAGPEDSKKETVPLASAGTAVLDPADALAATRAANAIANDAASLVGTTIANRYKVLKRLGEGGMGTVYEAMHTVLEKAVALKVLHPELARKQQLVDRFLQEAKAASRIRHVNVIDISDFGSADGHVYFAMELLHGHDLHEEITRAKNAGKLLPWERSKHIFLQICSALSVAHERGIVHRDLKPENIYLVEFRGDDDFVKLLDFGIAKMTDVSASEEGRKLTKTGMLFGTPEYMAPEQARGEPADHRVDIYAMGCILFLLVSNRLPFQADNFMGVLAQHLTQEPPEIAPEAFDQIGAPRELADVIDRALEKDREYRWQTIDELVAAICEVCGDPLPKERSRPNRAPSVDAPGETTRSRTPTDQPRSRTPSGSQRLRTPTSRSKPPTGPVRSKPPTSPPRAGAPEVSWIGSAESLAEMAKVKESSAALIGLGPVPEPEQKGHAFAIVSAIFVLAIIGVGAYALGWFGSSKETPAATSGSGAPDSSTIESSGTPAGSEGSAAKPSATTDSKPATTKPTAATDSKPATTKPTATDSKPSTTKPGSTAKPASTTKPGTSAPVTKPDSSPVTKPDSSPVTQPDTSPVTKPDTSTPDVKPEAPPPAPPPEQPAPESP
jgi:serine/threonine protein kinase